jgi:ABC-type dipeptide/oligopeptide/nickel transport system permease subunit
MRRLRAIFGSGLWRNPFAVSGGSFVALLVFVAALAPAIAPHDPIERSLLDRDQPPSREHWMGTDRLGRDVFSRVVYGARVSLVVGVIAQTVSMGLGITLGIVAGYLGGWVDQLVMWLVNVVWAFPYLLLVLAIQIALPNSPWTIFLAIGLAGWVDRAHRPRRGPVPTRTEFIEAPESRPSRSDQIRTCSICRPSSWWRP